MPFEVGKKHQAKGQILAESGLGEEEEEECLCLHNLGFVDF